MREKMRNLIPKNLQELANACPAPLYVVGGAVRDVLADITPLDGVRDWDICSPMPFEDFLQLANQMGLEQKSVFRNTGTVKLKDAAGNEYEYCSFRSDRYVRGTHVPVEIYFTDDITLDARRRDFTANAVYFDIKANDFVDPLDGITAISEKRLTTVAPAEKVFSEDGLRLMRLARQAACLGFTPDADCLSGAKANAALIDDITPERIFTELCLLLRADKKYGVQDGHYAGLKLLEETGVLARILPELTLGKGMIQRADFHKYDVLEHSLRAAKYADESIRLAALLHDIGKPICMQRDGNCYVHPTEGAQIAKSVLTRLKAPKKMIEHIPALVEWHMYDLNGQTKESKLRRFFVEHYDILTELLLLKQADFSACMDNLSIAPTCQRWQMILNKMQAERAPMTLRQLAVSGRDLLTLGAQPAQISKLLNALLLHAVCEPADNEKQRLLRLAQGFMKNPL